MGFNFRKVSKEDVYPYICDYMNKSHGIYEIYNIGKSNRNSEFSIYGRGNCGDYTNVVFEHYLRFIEYMGNLYIYFLPKYKYNVEAIYCVGNPNMLIYPMQVPDLTERIRRTLPNYLKNKENEERMGGYI